MSPIGQVAKRRTVDLRKTGNVLIEFGPPGSNGNRVDQRKTSKLAIIELMGAQCGCAAEVVTHDVRPLETPVAQQRRQELILHTQRNIDSLARGRSPVA